MKGEFQKILSTLPAQQPRSRSEPYREFIAELRQRVRTHQAMAQMLEERCQLKTSRSAMNDFVRLR